MPIKIPDSASQLVSKAKTDVQRELKGTNPFLKNHWLSALITGYSNRVYDFYLQLEVLLKELFFNTSSEEYLKIQASWYGVTILPATKSTGNIAITGVAGSVIPVAQEYKSSDGSIFVTLANATIATSNVAITSATRVGQVVTINIAAGHNIASNVQATISGFVEVEYNGAFTVNIISNTDFTYVITGNPTSPATGSGVLQTTHVIVSVASSGFGAGNNVLADALLTLTQGVIGVDNDAGVTFNQISGGTDQESTTDFRKRFLFRIQNAIAHFNVFAIIAIAREINGVTRVFVQEVTPAVGQVTVYFMRDNDQNPIPPGTEITKVKDKILTIKPANTHDNDVIVLAPTAIPVNFVFSILNPGTEAMKTAINTNLAQYFDESTQVGVNVESDAFRSVIFNSIDLTSGDVVVNFTITSPPGDVTIASGEIGTLGTITYNL